MRKRPDALEAILKKQLENQAELAAQLAGCTEPTKKEANPDGLSSKRKQELINAGILQATTFSALSSTNVTTTPAPVAFTQQAASQVEKSAKKNCCQEVMQMCTLL